MFRVFVSSSLIITTKTFSLYSGRPEKMKKTYLDKYSVGADASLSHIPKLGNHHAIYGLVKVSRVENNEWSVAAQLQGQFLHRSRALSVENLA